MTDRLILKEYGELEYTYKTLMQYNDDIDNFICTEFGEMVFTTSKGEAIRNQIEKFFESPYSVFMSDLKCLYHDVKDSDIENREELLIEMKAMASNLNDAFVEWINVFKLEDTDYMNEE